MVNAFIQGSNRRSLALVAFESVFIVVVVMMSAYLLTEQPAAANPQNLVWKSLLIAFVCQVCLYYADLYEFGSTGNRRELVARVLKAFGVGAIILAALYSWFPTLIIGQGVGSLAALGAVGVALWWRIAFVWVAQRVAPRQRLLLIGSNPTAVSLVDELDRRQELGVEVVGFVEPGGASPRIVDAVPTSRFVGTIGDIPTIVRERSVDRVVVSLSDARGKLPMDTLLQMKLGGVTFDHLASVYEEYTGKIAVENLRPSWLIFADGFRKASWRTVIKRAIDICGATIALLILWPVAAAVAIAVRLSSRGPALYHQKRVGQDGRTFELHKFRSMRQDAESGTGAVWASKADARVTPIGRFLRKTRLDELPQLWNILRGDMSIVGPRPERPEFVRTLTEQIPFYALRHIVKPGLSGWAQVRFPYGASVEDALEKLQYDLFYIKHMSIALDLTIMLETLKTVVLRRGT
jgi:sugar transferase (PEP-CTERM system associated)